MFVATAQGVCGQEIDAEHAGPRFASLLRAWPPLGWLGDRWSDQRQALVVYPRPKHGALLRRPNGEVGDQQVAMSIEGREQRVVADRSGSGLSGVTVGS